MTSTTIHYIDKLDDLTADMPEATKLWKRSREARLAGLTPVRLQRGRRFAPRPPHRRGDG